MVFMASHGQLHLDVPEFSWSASTSLATSPEGASPGSQRGRPSHWSPSNMRKLTRLYSYTDLHLQKIIDLIFKDSNAPSPSVESAQKKLKNMLDLENRWIRAKNDSDVIRRVRELSHSLARNRSNSNAAFCEQNNPYRNPTSQFHGPRGFGSGRPRASTLDALALGILGHQAPVEETEPSISRGLESMHELLVSNLESHLGDSGLLRAESWMSTATDQTTGSFSRLLPDKTPEVRSAIKKLLKTYSIPPETFIVDTRETDGPQLVGDPQASPPYKDQEPKPLPSDFLYENLCHEGKCSPSLATHCEDCRSCRARKEMTDTDWVTADGFTPNARRILERNISADDLGLRDRFGNTLFHFLAAHDIITLDYLVHLNHHDAILNQRNSANQSFLHVLFAKLSPFLGLDQPQLCNLLNQLADAGVDLTLTDCFGRTAFHLLVWGGLPQELIRQLVQRHGVEVMHQRDALGLHPIIEIRRYDPEVGEWDGRMGTYEQAGSTSRPPFSSPLQQSTLPMSESLRAIFPDVLREDQFKQAIDQARFMQPYEDSEGGDGDGRNPLHCLAMKIISQASFEKGRDIPEISFAFYQTEEVDSKTSVLELRRQMLQQLLDNNVDPNHYDCHGNTPLMAFAALLPQDGDYKLPEIIISTLIEAGADMEARNRAGETALLVATRAGNKLTMKALTDKGANVHVTDSEGRGLLQVLDAKMISVNAEATSSYAKFELCRAYLSGSGRTVQNPGMLDEWSMKR